MKTKDYTRWSTSWNALLVVLQCVVIGILALFVQSCRTLKESHVEKTEKNLQDSLVSEIRLLKTIPVPEAKVNLTVPIRKLLDLPAGASFSEKSGRANVSVKKDGDDISITASCDSLQALCEYYEREMTRIRGDTSVSKTESKKEVSTGIQSPFKLVLIGFIAGIVLTVIVVIKFKK